MPFFMIRNDITKVTADVIVNPANEHLHEGSGTSRAIYLAAGEKKLEEACRKIGSCELGQSVITPAFALPAMYVIHAVGPVWVDGTHGEEELLYRTYQSALALAAEHHAESIAFPLLSSGNYGYPKEKALHTAVRAITEFLNTNEMTVYLVLYDSSAVSISKTLFSDLEEYIDDHYTESHDERIPGDENYPQRAKEWFLQRLFRRNARKEERRESIQRNAAKGDVKKGNYDARSDFPGASQLPSMRDEEGCDAEKRTTEPFSDNRYRGREASSGDLSAPKRGIEGRRDMRISPYGGENTYEKELLYDRSSMSGSMPHSERSIHHPVQLPRPAKKRSLENRMNHLSETFSQMLLRLIDERGLKDSYVYKRANVDRRHFSKIRNNEDYAPNKKTVLAFAIALELSLDETKDLLLRAGYALSNSSKFDVILSYFIESGEYDVFTINEVLFAYDQPVLGA